MGWGNHHDDHADRGHVYPTTDGVRGAMLQYIASRLDSTAYDRGGCKDVAAEISDRFGVILTPGEIKDMYRSGQW